MSFVEGAHRVPSQYVRLTPASGASTPTTLPSCGYSTTVRPVSGPTRSSPVTVLVPVAGVVRFRLHAAPCVVALESVSTADACA